MKKFLISLMALPFMLSSCTYNTETGRHEVSIMFWLFIAALAIGVGVLIWLLCQKFKKK